MATPFFKRIPIKRSPDPKPEEERKRLFNSADEARFFIDQFPEDQFNTLLMVDPKSKKYIVEWRPRI